MNTLTSKERAAAEKWLLFFYTVPSKPVSLRMKIWRRLVKAGAVQMKGAVYILPANDDHYELCQWLVAEIATMKGDAAFVRVARVETISDAEVVALFNQQRNQDYEPTRKGVAEFAQRLNNVEIGGQGLNPRELGEQFARLRKEFQELREIDFFSSTAGNQLAAELARLGANLDQLAQLGRGKDGQATMVAARAVADYQGRTWTTRSKPFVDRMASAWLIRRFVDPQARFAFLAEGDSPAPAAETVFYDLPGAEFTHVGELCTFEVLAKAFNLKSKAIRQIAAIVHDLDCKDEKYRVAEGKGLEEILLGIRKTASDDQGALELGMQVFEMLHAAKKP